MMMMSGASPLMTKIPRENLRALTKTRSLLAGEGLLNRGEVRAEDRYVLVPLFQEYGSSLLFS